MIGGDFLLSPKTGHLWVTAYTFGLRKPLPFYAKGTYACVFRFERLESGAEIAFASMIERDAAYDMRIRARAINRSVHIDGKHLTWAGERVWSHHGDGNPFFKVLERGDGSKFYVKRWKLCLAQYRGVELGPIVGTRSVQRWEA